VALVEVDVVGLQALERGVDLLVDLFAGEAAAVSSIGKKSLVARTNSSRLKFLRISPQAVSAAPTP
jgi:hypothetical protein